MKHYLPTLIFLAAPALAVAQQSAAPLAADTSGVAVGEAVVTGTRTPTDIRHLPYTVSVVGRDKLEADFQPSVLPTVMQQVPGLMVTSRGVMGYGVSTGAAGGINLRGLSGGSGQMLILIDGHPQYNGVYGHPISDSYQTLMAERVEVLRGPASVLYGSNAMGGVMNIVTRGMRQDGVRTSVNLGAGSYGTFQAEAENQVRAGKFSSTIAGQYERTDNHRPHMGFEQYGGYAKLGYDFNAHWNAYADVDLTHFNSSYPGSTSSPVYGARQWITRGVVSAALENHYRRTNGALSFFSNFGRHKIDDGSSDATQPTDRYFRSRDNLLGISWYQSASFFRGNRVTAGIDYQHIYGRAYYTSKETGERLQTANKQSGHSHRNEVAAYVDFRQDIVSWLTLDAGVRLDHHSVTGTEWVPQGGIVVRPIRTGELKASVSKGFRNPTMRELYLYPPSNEDLEPERIMDYELAWTHRLLDGRLTYGATLFYIKGDNLIQTVARRNVNTGEIENWGAELEASWRIDGHWGVTTNHSVLHMEHHVLSAPEYKGFLGADFRGGRWTADAGLQLVSGLFKAVGEHPSKENFVLLNATVSYRVLKDLRLWVRGENLLAQKYETLAGYPMPRATFMGGLQLDI